MFSFSPSIRNRMAYLDMLCKIFSKICTGKLICNVFLYNCFLKKLLHCLKICKNRVIVKHPQHGFVAICTRSSLGQLFTNSPQCSRLLRYYLCTRRVLAFCKYLIFFNWYRFDVVCILYRRHKNGRLPDLFEIITTRAGQGKIKFRRRNDYFRCTFLNRIFNVSSFFSVALESLHAYS